MSETDPIRPDEPDEAAVVEYLRRYPEFLAQHPEVLAVVRVPHQPGGGATSLVERQVRLLREQNERLERQLADLLYTARDNERVGRRLLGLGRGLLEADSLDAVLALVRDALLNEFSADRVWIRLIDAGHERRAGLDPERFLLPDDPVLAPFGDCLESGEPVCGGFDLADIAALTGEPTDDLASAAVVPLTAGHPVGLVVLGSTDARHFHSDMGTHFLRQLGELVSTGVSRHLDTA